MRWNGDAALQGLVEPSSTVQHAHKPETHDLANMAHHGSETQRRSVKHQPPPLWDCTTIPDSWQMPILL